MAPLIRDSCRLAFLLAGISAASSQASGQGAGAPVIQIHETAQILAQDAVLSLARTDQGTLFVGSNQVSVFDGREWQKAAPEKTYGFRALSARGERVYLGATDEIGYWEHAPEGAWRYHSLTGTSGTKKAWRDVWEVQAVPGGALFVTDQAILRWREADAGNNLPGLEILPLPSPVRLQPLQANETGIWVFQEGVGIVQAGIDGEPKVVRGLAQLPGQNLIWMAEGLIGTSEGVYRLTDAGAEEIPALSAVVRGQLPVKAITMDDRTVAIGTFKAGVLLVSPERGTLLGRIDREGGLTDNSVYALLRDGSRLLIGLANGFAQVDGWGWLSRYDAQNGLTMGAPRKVLTHDGVTFILTDKVLYRVSANTGRPTPTPVFNQAALLRDALSASGRLWVSGFGGIWLSQAPTREAPAWEQALHVSADVQKLAASSKAADDLVYTENYALNILSASPHGGWASRLAVTDLGDAPLSLLSDREGSIWSSTVKNGIVRFDFIQARSDDTRWTLHRTALWQEGRGLPDDAQRPRLVSIGNRMLALTSEGALERDSIHRFIPVKALQDFAPLAAVGLPDGTGYMVALAKGIAGAAPALMRLTQRENGTFQCEPVVSPGLVSLGHITSLDLTAEGRILWIGGSRGLLRAEVQGLTGTSPPSRPMLSASASAGAEVEAAANAAEFNSHVTRIRFAFPTKEAAHGEPIYYQTRLQNPTEPRGTTSGAGTDGWSSPSEQAVQEFSSLSSGTYAFSVRAVDRWGRAGPTAEMTFTLLVPWWRSVPALIGYGLGLLGLGVGLVRWRLRRLEQLNVRLNQLVRERTRELELSNTAKSEFLESISHEIRNPLNGIVGLTSLMKEENMGNEERHWAKSLKASAAHLNRVSEEVLNFTKLEYGYGTVQARPFRLNDTLQEVADLYRPSAVPMGTSVSVESNVGDEVGFLGDDAKIKTVLGNFVSNALKHAPGSAIRIRAEYSAGDGPSDGGLWLGVTDQGLGIPPDEQEVIFQKFVRGTNAKRHQTAGTGIGLATCRVLAEQMGGNVGVESIPKIGTTFHLWLPLRQIQVSATPPTTKGQPFRSVLIVDDEEYNRMVLRGIALELGCEPHTAHSATDAFACLDRGRFEVIFLDLELPGMKGGEIARAIRQRPDGKETVIIATTAHDSDETRARCRADGMQGFVLKPYSVTRIGEELSRCAPGALAMPQASSELGQSEREIFRLYAKGAGAKGMAAARKRYADRISADLAQLAGDLSHGDLAAVRTGAHRLRSLAAMTEAEALNRLARAIEEAARDGKTKACAAALRAAEETWKQLRTELEAKIAD